MAFGYVLCALWAILGVATLITSNGYVLGAFIGAAMAFMLWVVIDSEVDR